MDFARSTFHGQEDSVRVGEDAMKYARDCWPRASTKRWYSVTNVERRLTSPTLVASPVCSRCSHTLVVFQNKTKVTQENATRQDNDSAQKASNSRRSRLLQISAYRFRRVNISQSETALCSAVLAQRGTDAMVPLVPWPVPGHQRLDVRQSPLGASQHAKKKLLSSVQNNVNLAAN